MDENELTKSDFNDLIGNVYDEYEKIESELDINFNIDENTLQKSNVNNILMEISQNNPMIFDTLTSYGIPYDVACKIAKRIIKLTLIYGFDTILDSPPDFIPDKPQQEVNAIDPDAIKPCMYRYVYLWQDNGTGYWTWLTYIGKRSISGWRWTGSRWVYFGIDVRKISAFVCF